MQTDIETRRTLRLTNWPSPQDFNEAVQAPQLNLADYELRQGRVYLDALGLPRPLSGAFASVYRFKCDKRDVALRCFLRRPSDQEFRYKLISEFVATHNLPYIVSFEYLASGVHIGEWIPALKMQWADGRPLDQYIFANLHNTNKLEALSLRFIKMMEDLRKSGVGHGDLQHSNILVTEQEDLILVDYDGMYVPTMKGLHSKELGHPNYQHPGRHQAHLDSNIDNFSAWVIYASLMALQIDSTLWETLGAGDDCLLFNRSDFLNPCASPAFAAFERHHSSRVRELGTFLRLQLTKSVEEVAPLGTPFSSSFHLEPIPAEVPVSRARVISKELDSNSEQTWYSPDEVSEVQQVTRHQLERELLQSTPRKTVYDSPTGAPSPSDRQKLLLPGFCLVIFLLVQAFGADANLASSVKPMPGIVHSVHKGWGKDPSLIVNFSYSCNGKELTSSDSISRHSNIKPNTRILVYADPKNPANREPLFREPGYTQQCHLGLALLAFLITAWLEYLIWAPALKFKALAQCGGAAKAPVLRKFSTVNSDRATGHRFVVEFMTYEREVIRTAVDAAEQQHDRVIDGDYLTVLYDRVKPHRCILYEQCPYKAVLEDNQS